MVNFHIASYLIFVPTGIVLVGLCLKNPPGTIGILREPFGPTWKPLNIQILPVLHN